MNNTVQGQIRDTRKVPGLLTVGTTTFESLRRKSVHGGQRQRANGKLQITANPLS